MSCTKLWNYHRTHSICLKKKILQRTRNYKGKYWCTSSKIESGPFTNTRSDYSVAAYLDFAFSKDLQKSNKVHISQTFPLILWLRTPSKLLITAPGRQFGTENLVNTLINWIRFHVEQTKSGEFVILGFLIITSSHFFTYWPLIIEIKKKVFFSIYWQGFDVKFQVSATEKLRFL